MASIWKKLKGRNNDPLLADVLPSVESRLDEKYNIESGRGAKFDNVIEYAGIKFKVSFYLKFDELKPKNNTVNLNYTVCITDLELLERFSGECYVLHNCIEEKLNGVYNKDIVDRLHAEALKSEHYGLADVLSIIQDQSTDTVDYGDIEVLLNSDN